MDLIYRKRVIPNYIIDSIRNPGEIKALAGSGDFILISIVAPSELRFARVAQRQGRKEKEPQTLADFEKSETREIVSADLHSQQLDECARQAQLIINNDSDMVSFIAQIDQKLASYLNPPHIFH